METNKICPNCRKPLPPDVPLGLCPECLIKAGFPTGTEPGAAGEAAGMRFVPPPVEEIARLFPQLEIRGLIGKGGMGAVYQARQPALDRFVALKVLPPALASDPGFAERFNREARALARLNHPNIVAVYDFGVAVGVPPAVEPGVPPGGEIVDVSKSAGSPRNVPGGKMPLSPSGGTPDATKLHYLLMEFVDGTNLREVERAGELSAEQALAIVPQICEALQFAHNEGIVHRDIKPENILLDKKGRVKITDFGIAKIVGSPAGKVSLTGAKDVMGTPHYMAPEQIEKPLTVDHRADIYSLGVVFYEMLTGELPLGKFAAPSRKVEVDVRLDEVVLHALEKEPSRRYQQASQVKTDVETIAGTPSPGAGLPAQPPASPIPASLAASDKALLPAFLLAFFFGVFGAHRFYVGKIGTAILQLCTFGFCGIWVVIDWILILCKAFTDGQGRRITHWLHPKPGEIVGRAALPRGQADQQVGPTSPPLSSPPGGAAPPAGVGPQPTPTAPGNAPGVRTGMIVAPAVGLMIAGGLKLLGVLSNALLFLLPDSNQWLNQILGGFIFKGWALAAVGGHALIELILALLILFGAFQMLRLRSYAWSVAAGILAIVSCSLASLAMGIWALIVLARPDVRETFAQAKASPPPRTGQWPWLLAAGAAVVMIDTGLIAAVLLIRVVSEERRIIGENHRVTARTDKTDDSSNGGTVMPAPMVPPLPLPPPTPRFSNGTLMPAPAVPPLPPAYAPVAPAAAPENSAPASVLQPVAATGTLTVSPSPPKSAGTPSGEPSLHRQRIIGNLTTTDAFQQDFSQTLPLVANGRLRLDNVNGRVEIIGSDRSDVVIKALKHGKTRESVDAAKINVVSSPDEIVIHTEQPPRTTRWSGIWSWLKHGGDNNASVDYAIQVPQQARLANIASVNGQVVIDGVSGDIEASTVNGEVQTGSAAGNLKLSTVNGRIAAELVSLGHGRSVSLSGVNGDIEATLPADADAEVSASTVNGSISSEFPALAVKKEFPVGSNLKGTLGNGGASVKASTVNGAIRFRQGQDAP